MSNPHRDPEDTTDTGQGALPALPAEAEPADVLDQLAEVPDPDEDDVVLDDDSNGIDPPDPLDRPGM